LNRAADCLTKLDGLNQELGNLASLPLFLVRFRRRVRFGVMGGPTFSCAVARAVPEHRWTRRKKASADRADKRHDGFSKGAEALQCGSYIAGDLEQMVGPGQHKGRRTQCLSHRLVMLRLVKLVGTAGN